MVYVTKKLLLPAITFLLVGIGFLSGQTTVQGRVEDARTGKPVPNTNVFFELQTDVTDEFGRFYFETPLLEQEVVLLFEKTGYQTKTVSFLLSGQKEINIGIIPVIPQEDLDQINGEDFIPTISRETIDADLLGGESISGLLTASRDIFVSTAAFNFGAARFRQRGYDGLNTGVYFNGAPVNDLESGSLNWSMWAGLNDVFRNRTNEVGLAASSFAFGGPGGASMVDMRAARQRRQLRVSYALSNLMYSNRVMASLSTGALPNGWAVTVAGSRRWTEEGYAPGTVYDAYSYFLSVSKLFGTHHELNLVAFGAPFQQGINTAATLEMYDLAGSNYYNPNWGYQAGEKRNARMRTVHQPVAILRHDWKISPKTTLTTSGSFQMGRNGASGLNWYDARDPRPDYYRRLPSFIDNEQSGQVAEKYRTDESIRQIDWPYMYEVNRNNFQTVRNANGIPGNDITGQQAQYIVEEKRFDSRQYSLNTVLESSSGKGSVFQGGLSAQGYDSHNYKLVDDLLDANFWLDIDRFAEFDNPDDPSYYQNDLARPNRVVQEGDTFGYSYQMHLRRAAAWMQTQFSFRNLEFFLAADASYTTYWREGNWANGKFPDNSKGESTPASFVNYGAKAGLSFRLKGRNYLEFNGIYQTRPPFLRDAFASPRTRNVLVPDLTDETIYGGEASYFYRGPFTQIRLTGYFTRFDNKTINRTFFFDNPIVTETGEMEGGFVNYLMQGVNTQHIGLEFGSEITLLPGLRLSAIAAVGQYTYISRPQVSVFLDQQADLVRQEAVYIKNFYVANTPQTALSIGLHYNAPRFWFFNLNVNYFDRIWIDFNPSRRTTEAVTYGNDPQSNDDVVPPGSELWKKIIYQEQAPAGYTLDFFGGKSWKIGEVFLYLNVGVNNILDKQNFIIGGFEQMRFDFENKNVDLYPNRYIYGFGRSYFVQVALRI